MKGIKLGFILFILSLLIFIGCSAQAPINPLDARNSGALQNDSVTVSEPALLSPTRAVGSDSEEGKEIEEELNFNWGDHTGELEYLDITIEYLDYFGIRDDGYVIFYIGQPMRYRITIKNTSGRTFGHLELVALQEYYEDEVCDRWWYPYPQEVIIQKGDPMPGDSIQIWEDIYLGPYSEIVLEDTYTPPIQTCDGLDRTHLLIKHFNNGGLHAALLYDDPELGVYCPPPPKN